MTYYTFIVFSACFALFGIKRLSRGFTDIFAICVVFMIYVFSQSNNYDHLNYQTYFDQQIYGLFEPFFIVLMYLFNGIVSPEFFLCSVFIVIYLICRAFGDNKYNLLAILYLSPLGVVSPRFFYAALLLSLLFFKSKYFFRYPLPVLTHYSTAPIYSFFLFKNNVFVFLVFAFVCFFYFSKGFFFGFISSFGIDYTRYLETTNHFSITNIAKYTVFPVVIFLLGRRIIVEHKYYSFAISLFLVANIVKFGMLDFEVMSRVATMFMLLGLYYVYNYGNNLARFFVVCYIVLNSLTFGFYGWGIYPDIYMESDQWINGR